MIRRFKGLTNPVDPMADDAPVSPIPKQSRGLIGKYRVERRDGASAEGKKHHGCEYFVLDLTHDPFASAAIRAYAEACEAEYPVLAADLRAKLAAPTTEKNDER